MVRQLLNPAPEGQDPSNISKKIQELGADPYNNSGKPRAAMLNSRNNSDQ